MLEKIRLDGYRLLDKFEADFGQLTVVIGANATGKSTLLDAISLITHSVDWPLEDVLFHRGGIDSILNRGSNSREIEWEITLAKPQLHPFWNTIPMEDDNRLVYEALLARDPIGKLELKCESLRNSKPYEGYEQPLKFLDVRGQRAMIWDSRTKKLLPFNEPVPSPAPPSGVEAKNGRDSQQLPASKVSLLLSQMRFVNEYPLATWIRSLLSNFCYYPGFDITRNSDVRTKLAEIKALTTLNATGENLGTVLHEILTRHDYRDAAANLNEFLTAAYPHIEAISAETAYGGEPRVLVRIKETGFRSVTEIWELSDGMLRFLLLCAALLNPLPPPFVAIDEPEAGLHPKLLPIIADMIRTAAEKSQVLVTTHSPELLSRFHLEEIAVMSRADTATVWQRPGTRKGLRQMLDASIGGNLAELHASGELEAMT